MEFEIGVTTCKDCKSVDECNKLCMLHCGKALVDFIQRVDVTPTKLGDYDRRERNGKIDLVVSGHQLYELGSPSWLLTDISTTIDASDKFKTVYDKNAFQLAAIYCKHIGMTPEEMTEITDKVKGINKNRMLVLPFKPHTPCNIDFDNDGRIEKKQEATIYYISWRTSPITHKLECEITFVLQNPLGGKKYAKFSVKDYITKFRLSQMDIQAKGNKHDNALIQVTDYGIFKPIYVTDGTTAVAIDGTYMYYIINGETHIIGKWDNNDKMVVTTKIKTKPYTKIMDNIDFIKNHKKYMAPYLLYESNNITV